MKTLSTTECLPEPLRRFLDALSEEQKLLLVLKRELYGGDWRPMVADLRNRLDGRPYIVRLATRIQDDLARIDQMREFERHYEVDLADHTPSVPGVHEAETEA